MGKFEGMKLPTSTFVRALTVAALGIGIYAGCEKKETRSPGAEDDGESSNLCTEYDTCDQCIAGQTAKGNSRGSAETECGAAVLGCWTTWDKPITCAGKKHEKPGE
jgi:hypothetical protein